MSLFKQLNSAASLCCLIAGLLLQHVAPQFFKLLHSWSQWKVQLLCSAVMRKPITDETKLDKQGKVEGGRQPTSLFLSALWRCTDVLFLFADCRALLRQQLLLLYPLVWSNPSLSCTVCLSDHYHSRSGDEAASGRGSATSLIKDPFNRKQCSRTYLFQKKGRGSFSLSVLIRNRTKE